MDLPSRCAAVIPCLNEAATIEPLVREVRTCLPTVIVVDDGSTDATAGVAGRAGAEVIRPARKRRGSGGRMGPGARTRLCLGIVPGWRRPARSVGHCDVSAVCGKNRSAAGRRQSHDQFLGYAVVAARSEPLDEPADIPF